MSGQKWVVAAVVLTQLVLVALVPGKKWLARFSSTTIVLQTGPFDPYDPLSGYYVNLRYDVESQAAPFVPPESAIGSTVWMVLQPGAEVNAEANAEAWQVVDVKTSLPPSAAKTVALRGEWNGSSVTLDELRRLHIPETQRDAVEQALQSTQGKGLAELNVEAQGEAVLMRLIVGDQVFGERK